MALSKTKQGLAHTHPWLKSLRVSYIPGSCTPLLEAFIEDLLRAFQSLGHRVDDVPVDETDILLTTSCFGEPISWRDALVFKLRKDYDLTTTPTMYTLVQVSNEQFHKTMEHLERSLQNDPIREQDFVFPGLAPQAPKVLIEQSQRAGPILALERVVQAQAMCIRVLLVVGDEERMSGVYHFDLVGAYPFSEYDPDSPDHFLADVVQRISTAMSTEEITQHQEQGEPVSAEIWSRLHTPRWMIDAAQELGKRDFFTDTVFIADLVQVPAVAEGVANQYSEGCFVSWEPELDALLATITGSARPVDKDNITEDELAIIVGVRPDRKGALVRTVKGKRNDPPSSEAVEMMDMDSDLPRIQLDQAWGIDRPVPVVRSKLHGHRGVASFDPEHVEHVHLEPRYYHYPVSCATEAQADGIRSAFSRSRSLQDPDDPRPLVFALLPGHGVVIVEKWIRGKVPFQAIWEAMDDGSLVLADRVPQGPIDFELNENGEMVLRES
jgi:hypothetical protein